MEPEHPQHQNDSPGGAEPPSGDALELDPAQLFQDAADSSGIKQRPSSGALQWEPPAPEELARWIPDMEVTEIIGRGGMGAVYKAVQKSLGRIVAIKLLPEEFSQNQEFTERFQREANSLALLKHPNIVAIHKLGQTSAGHRYFVMEYVDGSDFHQYIRSGKLTIEKVYTALNQICEALHFAHKKGYVHRDIKPGNIFHTRDGHIKVGDFGLAKIVQKSGFNADFSLTVTGIGMGTPYYSAPEQLHGKEVDHRADIYSLGVMLYEMLTCQLPQGGFKMPSEKVKVDDRLDDVVLRAIQEDPEQRYQSVREMQHDLKLIRKGPDSGPLPKPVLPPKRTTPEFHFSLAQVIGLLAGFAALFVLTGLVIWWFFLTSDPPPVEPVVPQAAVPENRQQPRSPAEIRKAPPQKPVSSVEPSSPRPVIPATVQKVASPPVVTPAPAPVSVSPVDDEPAVSLNLLDKQYLSALIRSRDKAKTANEADFVELLTEEIARTKSGKKVPETDPPETSARLTALRNIWRSEMDKGIPLFNGRDFEGWNAVDESAWRVRNGAIWGNQGAPLNQAVPFRHYELTGEIYVSRPGNGGIFLLGPNSEETPYWQDQGFEFAVVGSDANESGGVWTGGFVERTTRGLPNYVTPDTNLIRDSGWVAFRIAVTRGGLQSWTGGRPAAEMPIFNEEKGVSHIGLEAKHSLVGYRNLRIKEILN